MIMPCIMSEGSTAGFDPTYAKRRRSRSPPQDFRIPSDFDESLRHDTEQQVVQFVVLTRISAEWINAGLLGTNQQRGRWATVQSQRVLIRPTLQVAGFSCPRRHD